MPRFPLDTDEDPARTPPQTESPKERGFGDEDAPEDLKDLVRISEFDDLDSDSDIADEGAGHRG
jgi:hypothetical protein